MAKAENPQTAKFNKALASALSVSRAEIQDKIAQAKTEKPSPHTRYIYDPAEPRS